MSNYIKDPEEVLKQTLSFRYSLEDFDINITDVDIIITDSSDNDVTSGILVDDSLVIDNVKKQIVYYIQGGADAARLKISIDTTFSNGMVLKDEYFIKVLKQYVYLNKKAIEILPIIFDYKDAFSSTSEQIESYTVQCFKNNVLVNLITSTSISENNKVTAYLSGGTVGDRLEIIFKIVGSDSTTVLVDRAYMDIR